ncbi:MAG: hypothetical protein IPP19_15735 [Verrucomicrobia bacterium]|nr:hypothetical protein [Verrucomicrobiota bacterium]
MGASCSATARPSTTAARLDIIPSRARVIDPERSEDFDTFVTQFEQLRREKGITSAEARNCVRDPNYFATLMLSNAQADAMVGGATRLTSSASIKPSLSDWFRASPARRRPLRSMVLDFDEKKSATALYSSPTAASSQEPRLSNSQTSP